MNVIESYPNIPISITKRLLEHAIETEELDMEMIFGLQHACFDNDAVKLLAKALTYVKHKNKQHHLMVLERIEPYYLVLNKHILQGFLSSDEFRFLTFSLIGTKEEIWCEYRYLLDMLGKDTFYDQILFVRGRRLTSIIVSNGWITEQDISLLLEENRFDDYFSYEAIFAIYMIQQMKSARFIPILSHLLLRADDEVLITAVSETLISFQSNAVIHAILALEVINPTVIEIIIGTKTRLAFETLKVMFNTVQDMNLVILIINGLIKTLYVDAWYDVERLISETGLSICIEESIRWYSEAREQLEQRIIIAEEKEEYS